MPVRTGRLVFGRALALAALVAAALLCFYLLLIRPGGGYTVTAIVTDAGQLTKGNEVQVGGVPVGSVQGVKLRDGGRSAELELSIDGPEAPLHQGTTATIRNPSLTSIAGRYVALVPGPNSAPEIRDGGQIPTQDTTEIVDLDQLLNSLDPTVVAALSQVVHGSSDAASGRGRDLAAALHSLNPALSRSAAVFGQLERDQAALGRLVSNTSRVVDTLAAHRRQITAGTTAAGSALRAIAGERQALSDTLAAAPPTLRRAIPTLASLRGLLGDLHPALVDARPVAAGVSALLPRLRPAATRLSAVLPRLHSLVSSSGADDDATDFLRRLPQLSGQGVPLLHDLTGVLGQARPVLRELRPYAPEFTSGIVAGFGGSSGGYYDANGEYARISFLGGPFSLAGLPKAVSGYGQIRSGAAERCPGGANYPVPDGSNPFVDTGVHCDPALAGDAP
jgi:phospholipid/cholesterol/gamma-HCH transport system substrate-binding protein